MVRHGESEWNKLNLFCGWYDADLSDKGTTVWILIAPKVAHLSWDDLSNPVYWGRGGGEGLKSFFLGGLEGGYIFFYDACAGGKCSVIAMHY